MQRVFLLKEGHLIIGDKTQNYWICTKPFFGEQRLMLVPYETIAMSKRNKRNPRFEFIPPQNRFE